jgi:hypothetical protein
MNKSKKKVITVLLSVFIAIIFIAVILISTSFLMTILLNDPPPPGHHPYKMLEMEDAPHSPANGSFTFEDELVVIRQVNGGVLTFYDMQFNLYLVDTDADPIELSIIRTEDLAYLSQDGNETYMEMIPGSALFLSIKDPSNNNTVRSGDTVEVWFLDYGDTIDHERLQVF